MCTLWPLGAKPRPDKDEATHDIALACLLDGRNLNQADRS
jgi:hypothetical protein